MDIEQILPNHTVIIEDGRIKTVAPSQQIDTSNMRTVDGTGNSLLPGLADMHAHFNDPSYARMFLANGITTIRNMAGAPAHLAWEKKVEAGQVPGPHIISSSRIIDGARPNGKPALPVSKVLTDPEQAFPLVRSYAERGFREIKVQHLISVEAFKAVCAAAAHFGIPVSGHCPQTLSYEEASEFGMHCFEHLQFLSNGHIRPGAPQRPEVKEESLAWLADNIDLDAIAILARRLRDEGVWNCPTVKSRQGRQRAAQMKEILSSPFLRYLPRKILNLWGYGFTNVSRDSSDNAELNRAMERWNERQKDIVRILYEEKAPLLVGTDADNFFTMPGFSLHEELSNFIDAGCREWDVISFATSKAAEYAGESNKWGRVAEGMRADLVMVGGNPLSDLSVLQHPTAVAVNGYWLGLEEIDSMLEQAAIEVPMEPDMPAAPPAPHGWQVEASGGLTETFGDFHTGCCAFTHATSENGEHWVGERRADGGGVSQRRTEVELELSKTLKITNGRIRITSDYGVETHIITTDERGCTVESTDVDGFISKNTFGAGLRLLPTERLAPSLTGRLAYVTGETGQPALDYPPGLAQLSAQSSQDDTYTVTVDRETAITKLEVEVEPDSKETRRVYEHNFWGGRLLLSEGAATERDLAEKGTGTAG